MKQIFNHYTKLILVGCTLILATNCSKDKGVNVNTSDYTASLNNFLPNIYGDGVGGFYAVRQINFSNQWEDSIISSAGYFAWVGSYNNTVDIGGVSVNGQGLSLKDMTNEGKVFWYALPGSAGTPMKSCNWQTGNNGGYGPVDFVDTVDYPGLLYFNVPVKQKLREAFNIAFKSEPCDFVIVRLRDNDGNELSARVRDGAATVSFNSSEMEFLTRDTVPFELLISPCRFNGRDINLKKYYSVKETQHRFVIPVVAE